MLKILSIYVSGEMVEEGKKIEEFVYFVAKPTRVVKKKKRKVLSKISKTDRCAGAVNHPIKAK